MTYAEQAVDLGKELIGELALKITPDETLVVIDELVHTAVDFEMSGADKAEWIKNKVIEMAITVWDLLLPIIIKAIYDMMMAKAIEYGK